MTIKMMMVAMMCVSPSFAGEILPNFTGQLENFTADRAFRL